MKMNGLGKHTRTPLDGQPSLSFAAARRCRDKPRGRPDHEWWWGLISAIACWADLPAAHLVNRYQLVDHADWLDRNPRREMRTICCACIEYGDRKRSCGRNIHSLRHLFLAVGLAVRGVPRYRSGGAATAVNRRTDSRRRRIKSPKWARMAGWSRAAWRRHPRAVPGCKRRRWRRRHSQRRFATLHGFREPLRELRSWLQRSVQPT
jgi:hypothetical protein